MPVDEALQSRLRWLSSSGPVGVDDSSFGGVLRELRQRSGLSQRQLADQVGTTQSAIARLESGHVRPLLSTLEKLADALNEDLVVHVRRSAPVQDR